MTSWTEMTPAEFDKTLARDRKARAVIASAPQTLFPRLMPEPPRKLAQPQADPCGTPGMFSLDGTP